MLRISDESYERVQNAIEDINCCCVVEDDYNEWEDIAASSIVDARDNCVVAIPAEDISQKCSAAAIIKTAAVRLNNEPCKCQ